MEQEKRNSYSQLGIGIFLLIVGVVLLLHNFDFFENPPIWKFWPVILLVMGIGRLFDARYSGEYQKTYWMLFMGAWFLISELHIFGLSYHNSWPIILIGVGIGMLWKSLCPPHKIVKDHCDGI